MSKALISTYVPPELRGAHWLAVGEAPGEHEALRGQPFVGPTGLLFDNSLRVVGLLRSQFDIANVYGWYPGKNLPKWLDENPDKAVQGPEELHALIANGKYDAILGMGAHALYALTGKKEILKRRGSVYQYINNAAIPVLSTIHPANLFEEPKLANVILRDLSRFQRGVTQGWPVPRQRNLITHPTGEQLRECLSYASFSSLLAVDIETDPKTKQLICVGFATSPDWGVCLHWDQHEDLIRELLLLPCAKIFHNAAYDVTFFEYMYGVKVAGHIHDTMLMHHALHPELPKDLGFLTSLYTDDPYYKDTSKENLYRYNLLDTTITYELYVVFGPLLDKHELREVYENELAVLPIAIEMSMRGIKFDDSAAAEVTKRCEHNRARWQAVLDKRVGHTVNVYSHKQVCKLLYDELGLPPQYVKDKKTGKMKLTTGQLVLLSLYPNIKDRQIKRIIRALLRVRYARKILSTYMKVKPVGGRIRCSYNVAGAETGRWTASDFLIDVEGSSHHTIPPICKPCYIADEGMVLAELDYKQIEAMLVAYDAEDLNQIRVFESGGDIHRENACRILSKSVVTDFERQCVGKTVHALNYGIGPKTLSQQINKKGLDTGIWVSLEFAKAVREKYLQTYRKVVQWQDEIWQTGRRKRFLENYLGRRRIFLGPTTGPFAEATKGEMIAFKPQSTVPDMLNLALRRIKNDPLLRSVQILMQRHDALMVQGPEDSVIQWLTRVLNHMLIPLTIKGRTFTVPVDVKIGKRWSLLKKISVSKLIAESTLI